MIGQANQRWRHRRERWRPAGELIDPRDYAVDVIRTTDAKAFVTAHHYSGTYPADRLAVGLFRGLELVGAAVFSVPMQSASIPRRAGVPAREGVDLGRFVLLDEVPGNGETWFLARAFRLARSELGVRAIVSYSDPLRRVTAEGRVVMPGHVGTIYQAKNGRYVGRSKSRTLWLGPDGREIPPRSLSKIRNQERGGAGAYARLVEMGAPTRARGEDWPTYVRRALRAGPFRPCRHPGNHCYVWALERGVRPLLADALPYPKA